MDLTGSAESTRSSRSQARRFGIAAAAVGSALSMVVGTPLVTAGSAAPAVALTAGYQQALDDLLAAMKQAVANDLSLPYASPGDADTLMTMLQNTNYELITTGLSRVTELFNGVFFQSPEVVAGNVADSRQYFDYFTPDIYYHVTAGLAPGATYKLTGTLGGGTEHLSISTTAVTGATAHTIEDLELNHGLVVDANGNFTVYIGPEAPAGAVNFLDSTDATVGGAASLLIRDMMGDWAKGPGNISLQCVADCPPFFSIPAGGFFPTEGGGTDVPSGPANIGSVDDVLNMLFSAFAQIVVPFNQRSIEGGASVGMEVPANTMMTLAPETSYGVGLESAVVTGGNWDLDPGEALILKVPTVEAAYSGIELMNVYGGALPYVMAQTTLNNTTTYHADDGYTYYVVSATNPGVANWLDTGGLSTGEIFARFENVTDRADALGLGVETHVVSIDDIDQYLPTDTPTVSPEEFAADMARRVFSYDYALDVSRIHAQPAWVLQHLELNALSALMGKEDFESVFGSQPFTPIELRFTDALSPDWDAVMRSVFEHPMESLTSVWNALPVLTSDITLPITLALAQTAMAVVMPQMLVTALNDALFNPNTSILSGLLNARDDLATVILSGNSDWPTELSAQAAQQWANMADLIANTPSFDLNDLFGG
ncbi:hypothetical protein EHH44_07265 [Mycolicibacter terrae]|uniref:DUF1214 domain-containing protein n=2 Tax=Mycolicibacter TaxID=1073531 RepID=A0A1A2Y177_MYCSD|nr:MULTISPECIES: hypothetical protein [Mycolicibacter]OBH15617.1 hypothetical protein A5694_08660 [Mycolicibacter sinensis]OBI31153.1 hypothetical protein A5710_18825 [Mycolicibacter sinensis]RRR46615.1 hypothetical protein EHH44_07265 [Mycolicibacter terrae]